MSSSAIGDSTPPQTGLTRLIARWFAQARDVDGLLSLNHHLLVDIGLSRGARTYMAQHHRLPGRRSDTV